MLDLRSLGLEPYVTDSITVGQQFGRLTVRMIAKRIGTYRYVAVCECSCGKFPHVARIDQLKSGDIASCVCLQRDTARKHGLFGNPVYRKWISVMHRCYSEKSARFYCYGARGITVCAQWHDPVKFVADMGPSYRPGLEIDRIDVNGNYCPENCRWLTHTENAGNKRNSKKKRPHPDTL